MDHTLETLIKRGPKVQTLVKLSGKRTETIETFDHNANESLIVSYGGDFFYL